MGKLQGFSLGAGDQRHLTETATVLTSFPYLLTRAPGAEQAVVPSGLTTCFQVAISNFISFLQKSSRTVECLLGSRYTSAPGSCGELETLSRVLSDMGEDRNIGTSYQENETPYRVKEKRQVL